MSDTTDRVKRLMSDDEPPSVLEVSRMLNVSPQRVYQIMNRENITPPTQRRTDQ